MNKKSKWNYVQNLYSKTEWVRYYAEYSIAIDNLIERSDESQSTTLALPTLFLIRHSLELAFKMNLIELQEISGVKAQIKYKGKTAHVLHSLHDEFEKQVRLIIKLENISKDTIKEFESKNNELKAFRKIFEQLDNWSYSFRYPVLNDGVTKSFGKTAKINIADIIPAYKRTQLILKYTTDVLLDPANKN